jgi:hypothetical protein
VHVHPDARILSNEGAGAAGVIEMDVREQDGFDIAYGEAALCETIPQRAQRRGRTRIDDGGRSSVQETRGDGPWPTTKAEIDRKDVRSDRTTPRA